MLVCYLNKSLNMNNVVYIKEEPLDIKQDLDYVCEDGNLSGEESKSKDNYTIMQEQIASASANLIRNIKEEQNKCFKHEQDEELLSFDHTGMYTCLMCYKVYVTKIQLYKHIAFDHCRTEEKPRGCNVCRRLYGANYIRIRHTSTHTEARLASQRSRVAAARANETAAQRAARLSSQRSRAAVARANETTGQREARLAYQRSRAAVLRANESREQKEARLASQRVRVAVARAKETTVQKEVRRRTERSRVAAARISETRIS